MEGESIEHIQQLLTISQYVRNQLGPEHPVAPERAAAFITVAVRERLGRMKQVNDDWDQFWKDEKAAMFEGKDEAAAALG